MSMILDALRKMEQERKAGDRGGLDIRPEVVCYSGRPQRQRNNGQRYLAVGIALLLAAAMLALFIPAKKRPAQETGTTVNVATARPEPSSPIPQPLQQAQPAIKSPPSGTSPARAKSPAVNAKRATASSQAATSPPVENRDLVISGIAWQDERRLRRAVVNGELVSEGSEIAGSRVVEIRENRIRFSRSGRTFEVPYTSAFTR